MTLAKKADVLILAIVIIWGGTFPFIHNSMNYASPSSFIAIRFLLAALFFFPLVLPRLRQTNLRLLIPGVIIGALNGVGFYAQTIGLKTINSADSAFLTSLTVILIPLLLPLFKLGRPNRIEIFSVLCCLSGVYILTGSSLHNFSSGYGWTLVCALTTALGILVLQKSSAKVTDYVLFTFYQLLTCAIMGMIFVVTQDSWHVQWSLPLISALLYCAILASIVAFFVLGRYQQYTNPTRVGIILTLEPVFATIFAFLFNNEPLTRNIYWGGGIILASLLICELGRIPKVFSEAKRSEIEEKKAKV